MVNNLAVVITACDRYESTKETCESFLAYNIGNDWQLFFSDDASEDARVSKLLEGSGFECLVKTETRIGCSPITEQVMTKAAQRVGEDGWILLLQNDIETSRRIPVEVIDYFDAEHDVGAIRLYGVWKDREKKLRASERHLGKRNKPKVEWEDLRLYSEDLQLGCIHWSYQPTITRSCLFPALVENAKKEKNCMDHSAKLGFLTVRFVNNVTYHMPGERTPKGLYGRKR